MSALRPPTIYDVAARAHVSHQTVARMLRGEPIRAANRERIEEAVRELDYRPNEAARALARQMMNRVGVLGGDVSDGAPAQILAGAMTEARSAGVVLDTMVFDASDPDSAARAVEAMAASRIGGLLVIQPSDTVVGALDLSRFVGVPVVLASDDNLDGAASHDEAIALTVDHLVDLGHRHFIHLAGPIGWPSSRRREQVVRKRLDDVGLPCLVRHGDWTAASGHAAMQGVPARVSAVVSANDRMALGAIAALVEQGRDVPRQASVTGFDGDPDSAFWRPPLSTVAVDFLAIGRSLMQRLLSQMDRETEAVEVQPPHLIVRRSTAQPPKLRAATDS